MTWWRQPPTGWSLVLACAACAFGPLLVRTLVLVEAGALETLLFGISGRGTSGPLGLLPGEFLSALADGLAALRENLFLLAVSWAQPAQVVAHLIAVESRWYNPVTAVLGVTLLLWPLGATVVALVQVQPLAPAARTLLLLLAAAAGAATILPQGGAMIAVSLALLYVFLVTSRQELKRRARQPWLSALLTWGYLGALVVDLGVSVWLCY